MRLTPRSQYGKGSLETTGLDWDEEQAIHPLGALTS